MVSARGNGARLSNFTKSSGDHCLSVVETDLDIYLGLHSLATPYTLYTRQTNHQMSTPRGSQALEPVLDRISQFVWIEQSEGCTAH